MSKTRGQGPGNVSSALCWQANPILWQMARKCFLKGLTRVLKLLTGVCSIVAYGKVQMDTLSTPGHWTLQSSNQRTEVSIHILRCTIILPTHSRRGECKGQETFLAPSADKQTQDYGKWPEGASLKAVFNKNFLLLFLTQHIFLSVK